MVRESHWKFDHIFILVGRLKAQPAPWSISYSMFAFEKMISTTQLIWFDESSVGPMKSNPEEMLRKIVVAFSSLVPLVSVIKLSIIWL